MPFVRIFTGSRYGAPECQRISDILHRALTDTFAVPQADRFHFFDRFADGMRIFDRHYLSGGRSEGYLLFHIVAGKPRDAAQKAAFYRQLARDLQNEMGIAGDDVMVVIQFTAAEDWSFSRGELYRP